MESGTNRILFALLRSAICGTTLTDGERASYSRELLPQMVKMARKHDVDHLLVQGLKGNGLIEESDKGADKVILKAIYRYEQINYEYERLCSALEEAKIRFLPLKGSVLRKYYPEPWMRTSCDIDVLVLRKELEGAIDYLTKNLGYEEKGRATHDVSLFSPSGIHVELHFDLVEEGRANNAIGVLGRVWDEAALCENYSYLYKMSDAFFYFYHIAHMAKHFEVGGCGIRPFIDLYILDHLDGANKDARDRLLAEGDLLRFAEVARRLSRVWLSCDEADEITAQMESFILHGGVYGSADNRVVLMQEKKGGRIGYIFSRVFVPYDKLRRYYPILEKHRCLTPVMQVRRWFMLLRPDVAKMAKKEMSTNNAIDGSKAKEMKIFLDNIGL